MTADGKLLSDGLSDINACMQIEVLLPGFEGFNESQDVTLLQPMF